MDVHIPQAQAKVSTLSDDGTVGCRPLLLHLCNSTCVLRCWDGKNETITLVNDSKGFPPPTWHKITNTHTAVPTYTHHMLTVVQNGIAVKVCSYSGDEEGFLAQSTQTVCEMFNQNAKCSHKAFYFFNSCQNYIDDTNQQYFCQLLQMTDRHFLDLSDQTAK